MNKRHNSLPVIKVIPNEKAKMSFNEVQNYFQQEEEFPAFQKSTGCFDQESQFSSSQHNLSSSQIFRRSYNDLSTVFNNNNRSAKTRLNLSTNSQKSDKGQSKQSFRRLLKAKPCSIELPNNRHVYMNNQGRQPVTSVYHQFENNFLVNQRKRQLFSQNQKNIQKIRSIEKIKPEKALQDLFNYTPKNQREKVFPNLYLQNLHENLSLLNEKKVRQLNQRKNNNNNNNNNINNNNNNCNMKKEQKFKINEGFKQKILDFKLNNKSQLIKKKENDQNKECQSNQTRANKNEIHQQLQQPKQQQQQHENFENNIKKEESQYQYLSRSVLFEKQQKNQFKNLKIVKIDKKQEELLNEFQKNKADYKSVILERKNNFYECLERKRQIEKLNEKRVKICEKVSQLTLDTVDTLERYSQCLD